MNIEIKKSQKPVKYEDALRIMEDRLLQIDQKKSKDLIWVLEHENIYTAGTSYKENEILDKSINIFKTNRGGKITYHGPGQLVCYFVIDLKKIKKDIRNFISIIERTIIDSLKSYNINTFSDKGINKDLMLHSYEIRFMIKNKRYTYRALIPDYFKKLLKTKRLNFVGLK